MYLDIEQAPSSMGVHIIPGIATVPYSGGCGWGIHIHADDQPGGVVSLFVAFVS